MAILVAWPASTTIGAAVGGLIDDPAALGLDVALPAAFIAMLVPRLRADRVALIVAVAATLLTVVSFPLLPAGVPMVIAPILAIAIGLLAVRGRA